MPETRMRRETSAAADSRGTVSAPFLWTASKFTPRSPGSRKRPSDRLSSYPASSKTQVRAPAMNPPHSTARVPVYSSPDESAWRNRYTARRSNHAACSQSRSPQASCADVGQHAAFYPCPRCQGCVPTTRVPPAGSRTPKERPSRSDHRLGCLQEDPPKHHCQSCRMGNRSVPCSCAPLERGHSLNRRAHAERRA